MPLIETPLTIESLDEDTVVFRGSAVETATRTDLLGGTREVEGRFPVLMVQKEVWLNIGAPVAVMVKVEQLDPDRA